MLNEEARKYIVQCYYGKFWHFEKIVEALDKKYDLIITEEEIEDFVSAVDEFIRNPHRS